MIVGPFENPAISAYLFHLHHLYLVIHRVTAILVRFESVPVVIPGELAQCIMDGFGLERVPSVDPQQNRKFLNSLNFLNVFLEPQQIRKFLNSLNFRNLRICWGSVGPSPHYRSLSQCLTSFCSAVQHLDTSLSLILEHLRGKK